MKKILLTLLFVFAFLATSTAQYSNLSNVEKFPYSDLVKFPGTTRDVLRYVVDPVSGNDNNDGTNWLKAKKTINGVLTAIPSDLKSTTVYIFAKGGNYTGGVFVTKSGGEIHLLWAGAPYNHSIDSTGLWADFVRCGNDTVTFTDNPVKLQSANPLTFGYCNSLYFAMGGYNEIDDKFYYERVVVDSVDIPGAADLPLYTWGATKNCSFLFKGCKFLLGKTASEYFTPWGINLDITIEACSFYGGTGTASTTANGEYGCALQNFGVNLSWVLTKTYSSIDSLSNARYGTPSGSKTLIYNILTISNLAGGNTLYMVNAIASPKTSIRLAADFSKTVTFDSTYASVSDLSTVPHNVVYNGVTKTYLNSNYLFNGKTMYWSGIDSTRTFGAVSDSVMIKINLNGIDYWLKFIK